MTEVFLHENKLNSGVQLTEAAKTHILSYLSQKKDAMGIRLSVKKTGCSGLSYVVDYVDSSMNDDLCEPLNEHYQLFIDRLSLPYLKGVHIDYVRQGLNSKFVFNNPNQKGQCGCGESFTI